VSTEPTEEQPQPNEESHEARSAQLAVVAGYKDREQTSELRLPQDVITRLAFEAEFRGMGVDELIGALIAATMEKDLLQLILDTEKGQEKPAYTADLGKIRIPRFPRRRAA
jgi:hypothetical protein